MRLSYLTRSKTIVRHEPNPISTFLVVSGVPGFVSRQTRGLDPDKSEPHLSTTHRYSIEYRRRLPRYPSVRRLLESTPRNSTSVRQSTCYSYILTSSPLSQDSGLRRPPPFISTSLRSLTPLFRPLRPASGQPGGEFPSSSVPHESLPPPSGSSPERTVNSFSPKVFDSPTGPRRYGTRQDPTTLPWTSDPGTFLLHPFGRRVDSTLVVMGSPRFFSRCVSFYHYTNGDQDARVTSHFLSE